MLTEQPQHLVQVLGAGAVQAQNNVFGHGGKLADQPRRAAKRLEESDLLLVSQRCGLG